MWLFGKKKQMENNNYLKRQVLATMSGMWGIWDYDSYNMIDSYDSWAPVFEEDETIIQQIKEHHFIPINIMSDGAFQFAIKRNDILSDREKRYLTVESKEYLYHTTGKTIVSGIEYINKSIDASEGIEIELAPGYYEIKVCLVEWDSEPGAYNKDGSVNENALPDFIIMINNVENLKETYREEMGTFETPEV